MKTSGCAHDCVTNVTTTAARDGLASKFLIALIGAILAVLVRALWDWWRDGNNQRRRDLAILSAVQYEISALQGMRNGLVIQLTKEATHFENNRWSVKPFTRLPTGIYDLIKTDPPRALLRQGYALGRLFTIQAQTDFTNTLIEAQERWKIRDGPQATIEAFHPMIYESIGQLDEKIGECVPALNAATAELKRPRWRAALRRAPAVQDAIPATEPPEDSPPPQ